MAESHSVIEDSIGSFFGGESLGNFPNEGKDFQQIEDQQEEEEKEEKKYVKNKKVDNRLIDNDEEDVLIEDYCYSANDNSRNLLPLQSRNESNEPIKEAQFERFLGYLSTCASSKFRNLLERDLINMIYDSEKKAFPQGSRCKAVVHALIANLEITKN